jgi:L-amino acid N-acyltransferase YncA
VLAREGRASYDFAVIRLARESDGTRLSAIFAPYVNETAISFATVPPTGTEFAEKVALTLPEFPFLVLEEEGTVTAYAYASAHRSLASYRWCCEVSVYAERGGTRRGKASRLYGALLPLLRAQRFHHAYAGITLPNEASVALHEKFGFRYFARYASIGFKQGAWRDVGWWDLTLQPTYPTPPPEPLSFAALREMESAAVSAILGA